jgi:hypothetical protein
MGDIAGCKQHTRENEKHGMEIQLNEWQHMKTIYFTIILIFKRARTKPQNYHYP